MCLDASDQEFSCLPWLEAITTRENICSSISILWPSVNTQMGFRYSNYTSDADGVELVEGVTYDGGPNCPCSLNHGVLDKRKIIEQQVVALLKFKDQVCA